MSSTIKNILIFVIIFGALAGGYYFFGKKDDTASLTTVSSEAVTTETGETEIGNEFITTLLNIKNIELNDSIFSSAAFKSLQDFTTELSRQGNEGRLNPFAPVGADSAPVQQPAASTPKTTQP